MPFCQIFQAKFSVLLFSFCSAAIFRFSASFRHAGLISDQDGETVGRQYAALDAEAKALGSTLAAPFMTLSFMALLVIPSLKLSDKGLFDGDKFQFIDTRSDSR